MQFYASPEQIIRDRSEYARKGIIKSRSVVVMSYADGILFVAENVSKVLHKVSEIYDRIGFAAVGRYNEFENLRAAGVRMADLRGYSYARRDVTGRAIATAFTQTLGSIFIEQTKPFEVEICIAEVATTPEQDELYRITYDGQAIDQPGYLAMGGQEESVTNVVKAKHRLDMSLTDAVQLAVEALGSVGGEGGKARTLEANQLEVAVLDRARKGRKFRRLTGAALTPLLEAAKKDKTPTAAAPETPPSETPKEPDPKEGGAVTSRPTPSSESPAPEPEPSTPEPMKPVEPLKPAEPPAPAEPTPAPAPDIDPANRPDTGHPDADPTTTPEVPPLP
jgi:proteasome alpha subunit